MKTKGIAKVIDNRNTSNIGYPKVLLDHIKVLNNLSKDKAGLHPTQKPIELCEYLIKTYTNQNHTVLDFTMGSGSTGLACKNLNRNFKSRDLFTLQYRHQSAEFTPRYGHRSKMVKVKLQEPLK